MPDPLPSSLGTAHDLKILEQLENDPDLTQANLAVRLGVAVGTVNWYLKRLVAKGYVKAKRLDRRRLQYIVTREGIALRSRLTVIYLRQTMTLYRETRAQARQILEQVRQAGYTGVQLEGDGEIADICRLTGLEQGISVVENSADHQFPIIVVHGTRLQLRRPEAAGPSSPPDKQLDV
jgi:DNA-binding MarR family transcriptional regulator